jgi:hypothetical protein
MHKHREIIIRSCPSKSVLTRVGQYANRAQVTEYIQYQCPRIGVDAALTRSTLVTLAGAETEVFACGSCGSRVMHMLACVRTVRVCSCAPPQQC